MFRDYMLRWCAARTTPCVTAYSDERSEEECAVGEGRIKSVRRAYRTLIIGIANKFRHQEVFVTCSTLRALAISPLLCRAPLLASLVAVRGYARFGTLRAPFIPPVSQQPKLELVSSKL